MIEWSNNWEVDPFPYLSSILGPPGFIWMLQAVWCCRQCGVAGGVVLQAVWCCRQCGVAGSALAGGGA